MTDFAQATELEPGDPLIARIRTGDRDAFGVLYAQHETAIYRFAYRMLGNHDDAHDALQETFFRVWRTISSFRGDCTIQSWIYRICSNVCRTQIRSRRLRVDSSLVEESTSRIHGDPAGQLQEAENVRLIRIALRSLPAHQRELIVLREYEDLTFDEIGSIMGCSPVTVRVKLHRARTRLRERVESMLKG